MPGGGTRADGRVLRGRRNREAVVEAFLSLIEEGDPRPTARAIAERAGVSVRSVFQHFADLEEIYEAAGRRQVRKLRPLLDPVDPSLSLDERLERFVDRRRRLLEQLDPVARAARLREPFSVQLQANRESMVGLMREQCLVTFAPEMAAAADHPLPVPPDPPVGADRDERAARPAGVDAGRLLTAVATASSWSAWYHLRNDQGLEADQAAEVVRVLLRSLLVTHRSDRAVVAVRH
jgi:AcrR family transcriptional regulator